MWKFPCCKRQVDCKGDWQDLEGGMCAPMDGLTDVVVADEEGMVDGGPLLEYLEEMQDEVVVQCHGSEG